MGDFLTRLAERTLGVAPVVQPLIAPVFASKPTGHSPDLAWDSEATTSSDDLDWVQATSVETPPPRDAPAGRSEDTAMDQQENRSNVAPTTWRRLQRTSDTQPEPHRPAEPVSEERTIMPTQEEDQRSLSLATPKRPQRTSDTRPELRRPAETGSSEHGVIPEQEDQQNLSPGTPRRRQRTSDRPEPLHPAESGPTRRDEAVSASHRVLPEDLSSGPSVAEGASDQAIPRPIKTLVEQGGGATLPPQPLTTQEGMPESKATLDRSARPDASLVTPRMVRPRLNGHVERGSRESRLAAPEPLAPTIRVAIGRIEVRAITPPPTPPVRRETPARPNRALSLDDYLKQRNEGWR